MRWRLVGACGLLALLAVAALLLPSAAAQRDLGSPQSTDMSPNVLYLTPEVVAREEIPPDDATQCFSKAAPTRTFPIHGMSTDPPDSMEPKRLYADGASAVVYDCDTAFRFEVEERFSLSQGASASMWRNCHRPSPAVFSPNGEGEYTVEWAFLIYRNGESVAQSFDSASTDGGLPVGACDDIITPNLAFHSVFEPAEVTFRPGDTLALHFAVFNEVAATNSSYHLVDGFEGPSALYGPGLPGTVRPSPASTLGAEPSNVTAEAGPGNATTVAVPVRNDGTSTRTVEVDVEGPPDWPARPERGSIRVPADGTATVNLTVAAPPDALPDDVTTHRVTLTSEGEELVFETKARAVPGTGSSTDLVPVDEDPTGGGSALDAGDLSDGGGAGTASEDGGTLGETVSELWVEALATAIIATIAAVIGVVVE